MRKKKIDYKKLPRRLYQWKNDNKNIVILGMHRSGTSMISSVVEALGVNIGDDLLPPYEKENKLGYFEDTDFISLNDSILAAAGGDWLKPPARYKIILQGKEYEDKIKQMVTKKHNSELWGWKEPRTAITIELFLPYLRNPHFIYINRSYESVAKSLKKRDLEKNDEYLYFLAEEYNLRIKSFFSRHKKLPVLTLNYDDVLEHPKKNVKKLELYLGFVNV